MRETFTSYCRSIYFSAWTCLLHLQVVLALPIEHRSNSFGPINTASDAWAEAVSGISPLILLIGERNTKQLLREIRSVPNILGLVFAPLGLISVLTSMIRLCGPNNLRAYLGYEHEARQEAALETTRVNCGGLHAQLLEGYLVRTSEPHPSGRALATSMIQGYTEQVMKECIIQIRRCYGFRAERKSKTCPEGSGNLNWVCRIVTTLHAPEATAAFRETIKASLRIGSGSHMERELEEFVDIVCEISREPRPKLPSGSTTDSSGTSVTLAASPLSEKSNSLSSAATNHKLVSTSTPDNSGNDESPRVAATREPWMKITFFSTFDALSELSGLPYMSMLKSSMLAGTSAVCMFAVQILCLWRQDWWTAGWVMMFVGYVGLVAGVFFAAWLIYSACESATIQLPRRSDTAEWKQGVLVAINNTDSLDTTGSRLWQAEEEMNEFEAVWVKEPGRVRYVYAWFVSILLTMSFVLHYLGLRTLRWWLGVSELLICLAMAFIRSTNKSVQRHYHLNNDVRLDKQCYSTGVIDIQRAFRVDQRVSSRLDFRAYSYCATKCLPLTGETIAWHAAKVLVQNPGVAERVLSVVGIHLLMRPSDLHGQFNVVVAYDGGIITTSGLCFPNTRVCLAFPCDIEDISAPTPLLARGIMRQPEWYVRSTWSEHEKLPFTGGAYISSYDSLVTWWTLAEDRNGMGDQHKNLHGSLILLNTAFFIALLLQDDVNSIKTTIDRMHEKHGHASEEPAEELVGFLRRRLLA